MMVQYHRNPVGFIAVVEQVGLKLTHGAGGVFYLDHSAMSFGITEYTLISLSQEVPLQILHSKDTTTVLSEDFNVFLNNAKQWLITFLEDAGATATGIGGQIGNQFETGIMLWDKNPLLAIAYIADAMSLTIVSGTWAGIESRYSEMTDDPSLYTISNFLTLGIVEMLDDTVFPDDPWSFEHWMNIIESLSLIYGAAKFGVEATVGVDDLVDDAAHANIGVVDNITGLSASKIDEILKTKKGSRPAPNTYLSQEYIEYHLSQFRDGITKFYPNAPSGILGPPDGTYVFPSSFADDMIKQANGSVRKLEELLGLDPGYLGDAPVRIDTMKPEGLRIPSGNERGANRFWLPGGYTAGGIPEAVINQLQPDNYIIESIFE